MVLLSESAHLVTKFGSPASPFHLDLTSESLELVNIPRSNLVFDRKQLQVKLFLISLLKEGYKELARFEDL